MSVGFRAANSGSVTSAGSSVSVTKPTGTVDTDFLLAFQTIGGTGVQAQLTGPAGWANLGFGGTDGNTGVIQVWTKTALSEPASWTWGKTAGTGNMCVSVLGFSTPAATPLDGSVVYDQSTTAVTGVTSSGLTTSFTNDILVLCISSNTGGVTMTTPTGMTPETSPIAGTTNGHDTFIQTIAATGATGTRTSTLSTAEKWVTAAVAISGAVLSSFNVQKIIQSRAALVNASTY